MYITIKCINYIISGFPGHRFPGPSSFGPSTGIHPYPIDNPWHSPPLPPAPLINNLFPPEGSTVGPEGDAPAPNDEQPSNVPKFPNSSRRQFKGGAKKDNSGENKGENNQNSVKKSPRNSFQEDVGFDGSINQQGRGREKRGTGEKEGMAEGP